MKMKGHSKRALEYIAWSLEPINVMKTLRLIDICKETKYEKEIENIYLNLRFCPRKERIKAYKFEMIHMINAFVEL